MKSMENDETRIVMTLLLLVVVLTKLRFSKNDLTAIEKKHFKMACANVLKVVHICSRIRAYAFSNLHRSVRDENIELGRDSDIDDQAWFNNSSKYLVELARALASMPGVYQVDLHTQQVACPNVDWSYGEATEMLSP
nr:probable sucrose-phosphate synthase 1 [Tanacetum cinerariifolium]